MQSESERRIGERKRIERRLRTADRDISDHHWAKLLAAAQAGDAEAYHAFLREITPFARALARRRLSNADLVEDVVQDVLLTVHRVRQTYEPGRPVKPWLAAIVTRRSIDALRKRGRVGAREAHDDAAYETYEASGANELEDRDAARRLKGMIDDLPPRQKEAIELVKLKEMSLAEASARSGRSVASLKVNVHRAIRRLRLAMSKEGSE